MKRTNLLKYCIFATGLSGIVAEYILSTLAAYFLGDSVIQWTLIVSFMLFSMGVGSSLSKFIKNNLLEKFITLEFGLSLMTSFSSMLLALTAAILFVYLIMVALYDNWVYPFVVLFSIPVAMVGALLALAMTMKALSIFSMLGVVMLVGLVAKNAILLVDRASQMKIEQNVTSREALLEAGRSRLRPIIMTTLTMIMGMVPIAISTSDGSEWKSGLAWAIIGGLSSSLLLTLVLVPVVYELVDSVRDKIKNRFGKKEVIA